LSQIFAGSGVVFTVEKPEPHTLYSTIYIGGDDSAFSEYGSFLGLAEQVDVGNKDFSDKAFVFSDRILIGQSSAGSASAHLANIIAHEAGHLLGYAHEYEESESILSSQALAVSVVNQGLIEADVFGSTLILARSVSNSGTILAAAGGTMSLLDGLMGKGVITVIAEGSIIVNDLLSIDGYSNSFGMNSTMYGLNKTQLILYGGEVVGPGRILVEDGAQVDIIGLTFSDSAGSTQVIYEADSSGTVQWSTIKSLSVHSDADVSVVNNDFSGGTVLVSGDPSATVNMENNWWGTIVPAEIENKITHRADDPSLPWVDYEPWRSGSLPNLFLAGQWPHSRLNQENNYIEVIFSKEVDLLEFTAEDVLLLGLNGSVAVVSIELANAEASGFAVYRILFAEILTEGTYRVTLGPDIVNLVGNALD